MHACHTKKVIYMQDMEWLNWMLQIQNVTEYFCQGAGRCQGETPSPKHQQQGRPSCVKSMSSPILILDNEGSGTQ
jgi:hypothetical protein